MHAHEIVLKEARTMARLAAERGDDGTNDLIVGGVIRTNELQVWFVAEHVVHVPAAHACASATASGPMVGALERHFTLKPCLSKRTGI